jgi:dephospho-CoA kinase
MNTEYNPNYPIIVGLSGKAATGKTSAAEYIVPKASFWSPKQGMIWDHIFFAMPLYEFYSARTKIEGMNSESRKLFSIHETLYDLYGSSPLGPMPSYKDFVNLTEAIATKPINHNGSKPRSFLQEVGDMCRHFDPQCFAKWGTRKVNKLFKEYERSISDSEDILPFCVLVSDVRFENEADAILSMPNSMLIVYSASDDVRKERILSRDGVLMTDQQMSHKSEKEVDLLFDKASAIIDTSSMSVETQALETMKIIKNKFEVFNYA